MSAQFFHDFPVMQMGWALALSLVISALGFIRSDWFISIGYGLSMTGLAILFEIIWWDHLTVLSAIQLSLLTFYEIRLASYLISRESKPSYAKELQASKQRSQHLQGFLKIVIWLTVAALYVAMAAPAAWVLHAHQPTQVSQYLGVTLMALGVVIEMLADDQKTAFKAVNPDQFMQQGLYRFSRCPNYFGEMLFWTGNLICALQVMSGVATLLLALIGWLCIELIMLGSARRLEFKQEQRYAENTEFQAYVQQVPILIPFIPLYSLRRLKIYLG